MSISEIKALQLDRIEKVNSMEALAVRALTPEEQTSFDNLAASVSDIDVRLAVLEESAAGSASMQQNSEKLESVKRSVRKSAPISAPNFVADVSDRKAKANQSNALRGWFTKGTPAFRSEFATAANETGLDLNSNTLDLGATRAAQGIGSAGIGGALTNSGFYDTLTEALRDYNSVMQVATVISTSTGSALNFPLLDETGVTGELLSENGTSAQTAFTTATKTLNAYKYSSKQILTSYELFEDSLIDIESLVAKVAGTRLGRITENHMSVGTGSSQPTGIVVGANASTAVASTTAITVANIMTLIGNVDPAHRASPKCAFMMNSTTMNQIASILDTAGRPILVSNYVDASGRLPTILGYPVVLNNNMASAAAATKPIIFGDLSAYTVRTVVGSGGLTLVRQNETYAALAQIGWVAFSRFDGCVLTGNTTTYNPIWSLLMAAGA